MAIDIKKTDNWILIENKFLFNPTEVEQWIINLIPKIWEEMAYDRWNLLSIDFPGEYDIWWAFIKVFVWNGDKLNLQSTINNLSIIRDKQLKDIHDLSAEINVLNIII